VLQGEIRRKKLDQNRGHPLPRCTRPPLTESPRGAPAPEVPAACLHEGNTKGGEVILEGDLCPACPPDLPRASICATRDMDPRSCPHGLRRPPDDPAERNRVGSSRPTFPSSEDEKNQDSNRATGRQSLPGKDQPSFGSDSDRAAFQFANGRVQTCETSVSIEFIRVC